MADIALANVLSWFALAGTAVFAISGAMHGLRKQMDVVGVSFIATVTGVGGGTIRDLLLGVTPVGWVQNPTDILTCVVCALVVCLFSQSLVGRRLQWLLYADAVGLALFSVLGAAKAEAASAHPFIAVLFGAMSATFGGIVRDVVCNEKPVLFRPEIYITAGLVGAAIYVFLPASLGFDLRAIAGLVGALSLRLLAIWFGWSLPFPKYNTSETS
jgi:uncharacterized membrane protein YeiH